MVFSRVGSICHVNGAYCHYRLIWYHVPRGEGGQSGRSSFVSQRRRSLYWNNVTSEKGSQSSLDHILPMATSYGPPFFPQPLASSPTAIPVPGVANDYPHVKRPAQRSGHPFLGGWVLKNDLFFSFAPPLVLPSNLHKRFQILA